jgi:hypothetical protein
MTEASEGDTAIVSIIGGLKGPEAMKNGAIGKPLISSIEIVAHLTVSGSISYQAFFSFLTDLLTDQAFFIGHVSFYPIQDL